MVNDITQKIDRVNFPDNQHVPGGFSKCDAGHSSGVSL